MRSNSVHTGRRKCGGAQKGPDYNVEKGVYMLKIVHPVQDVQGIKSYFGTGGTPSGKLLVYVKI